MEWWLLQPEVLTTYAKHHATGEAVPKALLDKMFAAQRFNQGFDTIEYTACALVDQALHSQTSYDDLDLVTFEEEELGR
jgi:peptidyl-dipeptidase Dcp